MPWEQKADYPIDANKGGSAVLNNELYSVGGIATSTSLPSVKKVVKYDPRSDSWDTSIPDLPRKLQAPACAGVDHLDTVFSFMGAPPGSPWHASTPLSDDIFAYTPGQGWRTLDVRAPYASFGATAVYNERDGLIYVVNGGTWQRTNSKDIWTFDPEAEEIVDNPLATTQVGRRWPTVALVDVDGSQKLLVMSGLPGEDAGGSGSITRAVESVDLASGTVARLADAPADPNPILFATHSNPVIQNKVYVSHGMSWPGSNPSTDSFHSKAYMYDPQTDTWDDSIPDAEHPRAALIDGVIGNTLYVAGGHIKYYERDGLHETVYNHEAFRPEGVPPADLGSAGLSAEAKLTLLALGGGLAGAGALLYAGRDE